ncbi:MAG: Glyoxalase-like domain protein [Nocardioides sp.]|nr:Glyoxalase-like domain protein [Nocardioides sp.]
MRLHHVQVACPAGGEDLARRFYRDGLGMTEVEKPADLKARGGAWFRSGAAEIHLGVEDPFAPARKAHPALVLDDVAELEVVAARLVDLGFEVDWSQRHTFPGHERLHTFDGHGNRVEVLAQPTASSRSWSSASEFSRVGVSSVPSRVRPRPMPQSSAPASTARV